MDYFAQFDNVLYDFTVKTDASPTVDVVQDITTRVGLFVSPADLIILCDDYLIQDGETPEVIADKLYGDITLHWAVMYINKVASLATDWPLSSPALNQYITDTYGAGNEYAIHHTEKIPELIAMDKVFITTTYGAQYAVDVTNTDYEVRLNDLKRFIKVIKPQFINDFVKQFLGTIIK